MLKEHFPSYLAYIIFISLLYMSHIPVDNVHFKGRDAKETRALSSKASSTLVESTKNPETLKQPKFIVVHSSGRCPIGKEEPQASKILNDSMIESSS